MATLKTPVETPVLRKLNIIAAARGLTVRAAVEEALAMWIEKNAYVAKDALSDNDGDPIPEGGPPEAA